MKLTRFVSAAVFTFALAGCASSGVVGTWNGRAPTDTKTPFTFGSVSFVGDQTFTAESRYSGNVRVQSGTWSTQGDELSLKADKTERHYTFVLKDGTLIVTDPKSGHSITLDRISK